MCSTNTLGKIIYVLCACEFVVGNVNDVRLTNTFILVKNIAHCKIFTKFSVTRLWVFIITDSFFDPQDPEIAGKS